MVSEAFAKSGRVTLQIVLTPDCARSLATALRTAVAWGEKEHEAAEAAYEALADAMDLAKALRSATLPALTRFWLRSILKRTKP